MIEYCPTSANRVSFCSRELPVPIATFAVALFQPKCYPSTQQSRDARGQKDPNLREDLFRGLGSQLALPNGSRLSCGALKKIHSSIYARRQLQALRRRA